MRGQLKKQLPKKMNVLRDCHSLLRAIVERRKYLNKAMKKRDRNALND